MLNEDLGQPLPEDRVLDALQGRRQVRDSADGAFPVGSGFDVLGDALGNLGGTRRKDPDREPDVPDDALPSDAGKRLQNERLQ